MPSITELAVGGPGLPLKSPDLTVILWDTRTVLGKTGHVVALSSRVLFGRRGWPAGLAV